MTRESDASITSNAGVPTKPVASPVLVHGTRIRRTYVAPCASDRVQLGDIVLWNHQQWDVVGSHMLAPEEATGHRPLKLQLERLERPNGKRKVVREYADAREIVILGRQILLPGTAQVEQKEAERARDTG